MIFSLFSCLCQHVRLADVEKTAATVRKLEKQLAAVEHKSGAYFLACRHAACRAVGDSISIFIVGFGCVACKPYT